MWFTNSLIPISKPMYACSTQLFLHIYQVFFGLFFQAHVDSTRLEKRQQATHGPVMRSSAIG